MALLWPSKKVALDIVDDPTATHFSGDEQEWKVVRVTCAEMDDYHSFRKVMERVAHLLNAEVPKDAAWEQRNRELHAALMAHA